MISYNAIKIIHIISACVLFGTGIGTAFYMLMANFQKNLTVLARVTAQVVRADAWFTGISGFLQPVTGFMLLAHVGYPLMAWWTCLVLLGYGIAGIAWFVVVWLQIQCRNLAFEAMNHQTALSARYHRYFRTWIWLGILAFVSLMGIFYLMANPPFLI